MIGKFMYTRLAITGSPTGLETEKSSERVSGMTLNWTAILSYKRQSHLCCLSTEPYVSHILEFVGCQSHLSLPVTNITQNIFLTSSMNLCGSIPTCDPKNLDGFILTKSQTLAAIDRSFLLVRTRT